MSHQEQHAAPAAESKTKAAPAEKKVARPKDEKHGIARPADLSKGVGRVWAIADEISGKLGSPAPRADVMAKAEAEGMNPSTVATQYGRWRTYNGLKGTAPIRKEKAPKPPKEKKAKAEKASATVEKAQ